MGYGEPSIGGRGHKQMIQLKYFEKKDYKQLIAWIESPKFLLQWGGPGFHYPLDEAQLDRYMGKANKEGAETLIYKVLDSNTIIGHISLGKIDLNNRSARIGKVLVGNQNTRGKGVGQQMILSILEIAFEQMGLHRVSLGVFDFNAPAIRCYEKAGFTKEGLLLDARKYGDEYWSLWEMSMLEEEWETIKKS